MSKTGAEGLSPTQAADAKIQAICDEIKPKAEIKLGKKFKEFTAVSYRSQDLDHVKYFIKVNVGDNNYAHIRVCEKPPSDGGRFFPCVIHHGKTLEDPIEYISKD